MKFKSRNINGTSLLSVILATKIGGDIVTSLVGNDLNSEVEGSLVGGQMAYRSIAAAIGATHNVLSTTYVPEGDEIVEPTDGMYSEAGDMALELDRGDMQFLPVANTPLADICSPMSRIRVDGDDLRNDASVWTLATFLDNPYLNQRIGDVVRDGEMAVGSLVSVCRNQVLPAIREVLSHANEYAKNNQRRALFPFTIIQDDIPALWKDNTFLASLPQDPNASASDKDINSVTPLMGIQNKDVDLKQMVRLGIPQLDDIIQNSIAADYNIGWVWEIISRQGNVPLRELLTSTDNGFITSDNRRLYITIAYLLARHITVVGVDVLNPKERDLTKEHFSKLTRVLGLAIRNNKRAYESVVKGGTIIQRTRVSGDGVVELIVNADTYRTWLQSDEANSPELLYSSSIVLGAVKTGEEINKERIRLAGEWNRIYTLAEGQRVQKERELMKKSLVRGFVNYLHGYSTPEGGDIKAHEAFKQSLLGKVEKTVGQLQYNQLTDLPSAARDLVCQLLFADTDACNYLCIFDRLGESHKDKDPRTVATLTTFEYVGKWVASQLQIVPK